MTVNRVRETNGQQQCCWGKQMAVMRKKSGWGESKLNITVKTVTFN